MKTLLRPSIGGRLALIALVVALGVAAGGAGMVRVMQQSMVDSRIASLRGIVESMQGLAAEWQKRVQAGELTQAAALHGFAQEAMAMTRDHGDGYVFVYGLDGMTYAMPDASKLGTNQCVRFSDSRFCIFVRIPDFGCCGCYKNYYRTRHC